MENIAPFEVKIYIAFESKKGPKSIFADIAKTLASEGYENVLN
jgi:hypothetical protein